MGGLRLIFIIGIVFVSARGYSVISDTLGITPDTLSLSRSNIYTTSTDYAPKDNPAGLARLKRPTFSFSYFYLNPNLENANAGRITPADSRIVEDKYDSSKAGSFKNVLFSLGIPLGDRLSFGLLGLLPTSTLATVYTSTKNEVRYLLYDDRAQRPEIYSSVGYQLSERFSIGTGLFYSVKADGSIQMGMSTTDADARTMLELKPELIPFASLNYNYFSGVMGIFYRAPQKSKTTINYDIDFAVSVGSVPFSGASSLVAFYDPQVLGIGHSYHFNQQHSLHASIRRSFWSNYTPPIIRLSGKDLESYTSGSYVFDSVKLRDCYDVSLGHEIKRIFLINNIENVFKWGMAYHESALPDQPRSLAIVDTDRYDFSVGSDFVLDRLGNLFKQGMTFSLAATYSILESKTLTLNNQSVKVGKNIFTISTGGHFDF